MNETPATKVLPQRRWFQLRLRTLLVLVTLVSMLLGWISWEQERRRQEQTTIAWVEEMGGTVSFESKINSGLETSGWKKTKDAWEKIQKGSASSDSGTLSGQNLRHKPAPKPRLFDATRQSYCGSFRPWEREIESHSKPNL